MINPHKRAIQVTFFCFNSCLQAEAAVTTQRRCCDVNCDVTRLGMVKAVIALLEQLKRETQREDPVCIGDTVGGSALHRSTLTMFFLFQNK